MTHERQAGDILLGVPVGLFNFLRWRYCNWPSTVFTGFYRVFCCSPYVIRGTKPEARKEEVTYFVHQR